MKQILIFGFGLFILLMMQMTWLPVWFFSGAEVDLLLVVTVCAGLLAGREQGVAVGFFAGLLQDLLSGFLFGYHTLTRMLCGFLCGLMEKQIFKENFLVPMVAAASATVATQIFYWLSAYFVGEHVVFSRAMLFNLIFSSVCNGALAWPIYELLRWLYRASETK